MASPDRFLVTGAMGCLGAWVVRTLLDEGATAVAIDLSTDVRRLRLLATDDELAGVTFVRADISDPTAVRAAVVSERITHVVHCAALQVPFVRANPTLGAQVNVTGTVNVFEAVLATREQVAGLAYASAAGVFGLPDRYPGGEVRDDDPQDPQTLYGVFKQANEGTARIYHQEHGLSSVGLRPWVIYGPGRDQGMTSGATVAMLAAAAGVPYHIPYGGESCFHHASDVARAFVTAARAGLTGARVFNLPGETITVERIVGLLGDLEPTSRGRITFAPDPIAAVARVDAGGFVAHVDDRPFMSVADGTRMTVAAFRGLLGRGLVEPPR